MYVYRVLNVGTVGTAHTGRDHRFPRFPRFPCKLINYTPHNYHPIHSPLLTGPTDHIHGTPLSIFPSPRFSILTQFHSRPPCLPTPTDRSLAVYVCTYCLVHTYLIHPAMEGNA